MPALRITGMLVGGCLLSPGLAAANDTAIKLPQTMQAAGPGVGAVEAGTVAVRDRDGHEVRGVPFEPFANVIA